MIRHITYCNDSMTISAEKCSESAMLHGCDVSTIYTEECLDSDFVKRNRHTLDNERGAGFWIWKPQIILQELAVCQPGDVLIYTDAGVEFINPVQHLVNKMDSFCMFFEAHYWHHEYCKGDVLFLSEYTTPVPQLQATSMLFKYSLTTECFVEKWLSLCQEPGLIDDSPSYTENHPKFKEHRHDQAILTTLAIMHGIQAHAWPARYYNGTGYFDYLKTGTPIFNHHRKRNSEW